MVAKVTVRFLQQLSQQGLFDHFRLANDAKVKGKERQFNGLIDVYRKTLKSDGIQGLYRGFTISCVGIFIYRGMYFGLYDSLKPILLGEDASVLLSFLSLLRRLRLDFGLLSSLLANSDGDGADFAFA